MKKIALIISFLVMPLHAGIKIPKGVFLASQMEAAQAKAIEEKKPLVFVLTDSKST